MKNKMSLYPGNLKIEEAGKMQKDTPSLILLLNHFYTNIGSVRA